MCAQSISLTNASYSSDVVQDDHFEANAVLTKDYLDPGGAYDRMLQQMGWSCLRFPGGTVVEEGFEPGSELVDRFYDVNKPSGLSDDGSPRIVTAPAAYTYTYGTSDQRLRLRRHCRLMAPWGRTGTVSSDFRAV